MCCAAADECGTVGVHRPVLISGVSGILVLAEPLDKGGGMSLAGPAPSDVADSNIETLPREAENRMPLCAPHWRVASAHRTKSKTDGCRRHASRPSCFSSRFHRKLSVADSLYGSKHVRPLVSAHRVAKEANAAVSAQARGEAANSDEAGGDVE